MNNQTHYRLAVDFLGETDLDRESLQDAFRNFFATKCQNTRITQIKIFPPYYRCTNCDFEHLEEEPFYSYEICSKCGVEFGVDDPYLGKDRATFEKEYYKK